MEQHAQIADQLPVKLMHILATFGRFGDEPEASPGIALRQRIDQLRQALIPAQTQDAAHRVGRHDVRATGIAIQRELVEQTLGIPQAAGRLARDERQRLILDGEALPVADRAKPPDRAGQWNAAKVKSLAAGGDRVRKLVRLGGRQDELHMRRRLFQRLEEGVERVPGELMRLIDNVELHPQLGRRVLDLLAQVANVIDPAIRRRVDLDNVDRRAGVDRIAGSTVIAGTIGRIRIEAVDGFGEQARGAGLPGAARTAEEVRVRHPIERDRVLQRACDVLLTYQLIRVKRGRPVLPIQ